MQDDRILIAFDFDQSFVDHDSDIFVVQTLCPELFAEIMASNPQLPEEGVSKLMDGVFHDLHLRMPELTREQILDTAARVPVMPAVFQAVKLAIKSYNAHVVIVSDANEMFIRALLARYDMEDYVAEIYANGAHWEDATSARLRITPHHAVEDEPHGCPSGCPRNLCKAFVMDQIRKKHTFRKVLYVGDGNNDVCPATRLMSRDTVFARAASADGRTFDLLGKLLNSPDTVAPCIVPWSTGDELLEHLKQALQE